MSYKKIKICQVASIDVTIRFILLSQLRFLLGQGYDVYAICSDGRRIKEIEKEGIKVKTIKIKRKISPFYDLITFCRMFFYFKREKFDIVHTHTPKAGFLARISARLAGVPVVIHTSHGFYVGSEIDSYTKKTIELAEKIAAHFCDLVFSINKEDVAWALENRIVAASKIKYFPLGIDITRFNPQREKRELAIDEGKKNIGIIGRFVKEKGYLDLFEAFGIVKKQIPNAFLILVAPKDKEKRDALDEDVLKEYSIDKQAIFLGYEGEITDIEKIYPLMDVFVLPSLREGFPFSIMEASASGVPVVATDIRGCREAVENSKTGILVPPKNPEKLAEAIIYLLSNPNIARQMGEAGRKKAEKDFDERGVFDRIKKEYERLILEKGI